MIKKYALFKAFSIIRFNTVSVRSLARSAKIGIATSKRCLDYLYEAKVLKRQTFGRLYQYSLDTSNSLARQLKITHSIAELQGLLEEIQEMPGIISITLYGSAAKGLDSEKSDIDLLVISQKKERFSTLKAERSLRELNIISFTYREWKTRADDDKPFYEAVITEGIPLLGELPVVR